MQRITFGKGGRKLPKNALQNENATPEQRKRFILKCASGGFARGNNNKPKVTLAPVPSLKDK